MPIEMNEKEIATDAEGYLVDPRWPPKLPH